MSKVCEEMCVYVKKKKKRLWCFVGRGLEVKRKNNFKIVLRKLKFLDIS